MAKYRIVRRERAQIDYEGGEHYWRALNRQQAAELDLAEIRELNQLREEAPKRLSWPLRLAVGLVAMLVLVFLLTMDLLPFLHMPDLSFLSRSAELGQDEALASLKTAVVSIEGAYATGSGFNLRAEGLIVSNRHVVEGNTGVMVVFPDGRRYPARAWQYVEGYDLAVAHIAGTDLPHVELSSEIPESGDPLIFIGNPLGFDWTISEAVMLETISFGGDGILYFSGPVRSGSSGSPLFNANGQVAGVIFATLREVEDSGLAIPAQLLLSYVEDAE